MKMTKKFFAAALAVAALSLVGCNYNEDEYGILDFDDPNGVCTVDYTNETKDYIRGWATFNTGHISTKCIVKMDNLNKITNYATEAGNMGYVFNLTKNDDKTYNFNVITLKYGGNDKLKYYISYYENVKADYLSGPEADFCDINGLPASKPSSLCKETQLTTQSETWSTAATAWKVTDNSLKAFIVVDFSEKIGEGYSVKIYDGDSATGTPKITLNNIVNGLEEKVDKNNPSKKYYATPDNKIGAYAMVKPGQTLTGSWKFVDIKGNAIPLELAD